MAANLFVGRSGIQLHATSVARILRLDVKTTRLFLFRRPLQKQTAKHVRAVANEKSDLKLWIHSVVECQRIQKFSDSLGVLQKTGCGPAIVRDSVGHARWMESD